MASASPLRQAADRLKRAVDEGNGARVPHRRAGGDDADPVDAAAGDFDRRLTRLEGDIADRLSGQEAALQELVGLSRQRREPPALHERDIAQVADAVVRRLRTDPKSRLEKAGGGAYLAGGIVGLLLGVLLSFAGLWWWREAAVTWLRQLSSI